MSGLVWVKLDVVRVVLVVICKFDKDLLKIEGVFSRTPLLKPHQHRDHPRPLKILFSPSFYLSSRFSQYRVPAVG